MAKDYAENFLEAMDLLVKKRLEGLEYNKTVLCKVVEALDEDQRVYRVSDGSNSFVAYAISSQFVFEEGDSVYVSIPNGDYNRQKYILGREVTDNSKDYAYLDPMAQFFDITGNLLTDENTVLINENGEEIEGSIQLSSSLLANKPDLLFKNLGTVRIADGAAYTRMAIQADFRSLIPHALNGNYGLLFKINTNQEAKASEETENITKNSILLDSADMWGNPYDFEEYYNQKLVFDISQWNDIDTVQILFYQSANFYSREDRSVLIDYQTPGGEELPDNLFVKNISLSLGYGADDEIEENGKEKVVIYTKNSLTYSSSLNDEQNRKTVKLRWSHCLNEQTRKYVALDEWSKIEDYIPEVITNIEDSEIKQKTIKIHWYRFDKNGNDELAGTYWTEIENDKKQFSYTFDPRTNLNNEYIKCIIEIIDNEELNNINNEYNTKEAEYKAELEGLQNDIDVINASIIYNQQCNTNIDGTINGAYDNTISLLEVELVQKQDDYDKTQKRLNRLKLDVSPAYTYLRTDILTFTSEINKEDESAIDYVQGLSLTCEDGGIYRIYDALSNDLISSSEEKKNRTVTLHFKSLLTQDSNAGITQVRWYIPKGNTMIQTPIACLGDEDDEKNWNYKIQHNEDYDERFDEIEDYYVITRNNPSIVSTHSGTYSTKECKVSQTYRIKSHLMQTNSNNTIKCEVVRNNIVYGPVSVDLVFGAVGSNGTNNTLIVSMGSEYDANDEIVEFAPAAWTAGDFESGEGHYIVINAHLYDDDNNLVDDLVTDWKFKLLYPSTPSGRKYYITNTDNVARLSADPYVNGGCIVQCIASLHEGIQPTGDSPEDYQFVKSYIGYLPIAVRGDRNYKIFNGADRIIYSSNGGSPKYYKSPYYIELNNSSPIVQDRCYVRDGSNTEVLHTNPLKPENNYLPYMDNNMLHPRTMYLHDVDYDVEAIITGIRNEEETIIMWAQPILVLQNQWGSSVLNQWDGSFSVNEEQGTILGTMLGAGKKETTGAHANTFSGVLMGDVTKGIKDTTNGIGLYGYQYGIQSFGFTVDGKAFIGKQQKSQILFDGNNGTIKNYAFDHGESSSRTGIELKMDGDTSTNQTLTIRKSGIDIVKLSSGNPYLKINGADGKRRLEVNDSNTIIGGWTLTDTQFKSNNNKTILDEDGTITCWRLYASESGTIGGWTIGSSTLTGGNTTLDSNGTITCTDLIATNTGKIGPYKISSGSLSGSGVTLGGSSIKIGSNLTLSSSNAGTGTGKIEIGGATIQAHNIGGYMSISFGVHVADGVSCDNYVSAPTGHFDNLRLGSSQIGESDLDNLIWLANHKSAIQDLISGGHGGTF